MPNFKKINLIHFNKKINIKKHFNFYLKDLKYEKP